MTNQTHDPRLTSWVSTAQSTDTDFPIQNLPFGVFRRASAPRRARVGVAIGDEVLDLSAALAEDLLDSSLGAARDACGEPTLNALMSLGRPAARALRQQVSLLLRQNDRTAPASKAMRARVVVPAAAVEMQLPATIGDYTDFYASIHHATNVGALFSSRQPAADELQVDPDRLSRARLVARAVTLDVWLATAEMRRARLAPVRLARSSATNLYWTFAQMLSHHTSNGCNLRPGDLLASGTISGPTRDALGCLLELTRRGSEPIKLPGGETRAFLQDGDEIVFTAHCAREGAARIGFGECRGLIVGSGPV